MSKSPKKSRAKAAKAVKAKSARSKPLTRAVLVATPAGTSFPVDIKIDFFSGLGQVTAVLFRNGVLINMQSISTSGRINFSDVQSGDTVAVNGVCAGTADITVSVPTNPSTPEHFAAGIIMTGYTIL